MSDDEIRARAAQARSELNLTESAFERMRAEAVARLFASKEAETALREQLYRAVQTIDTVRNHLAALVQDAEVADFAEAIRAELS
jgi:hypothetical protein